MAIQTPFGHAAIARLIGAAVLVIGFVWRPLAIVGALILVGSYLAEGHTVASDDRLVLAALLFAHLAVVHWWLGALVPLRSLVVSAKASGVAHQVERFGGTAVWAVAGLFIAGFVTLGVLTGWLFDPSQAYQQTFALKLAAFAVMLLIAAVNRLRWTPLLSSDPARARRGLQGSIGYETFAAAAVLAATAIVTSFPPTAQ